MPGTLTQIGAIDEPPVSLEDLKLQVRVIGDHDDIDLAHYLDTARESIEDLIGRSLAPTLWRQRLKAFPDSGAAIDLPPEASAVLAIRYTDLLGEDQTLDAADYHGFVGQPHATIFRMPEGSPWPDGLDVEIDYRIDPPLRAKQAIRLLAAHWYQVREPVSDRSAAEIPFTVMALVTQLRGILCH